MHQKPTRVEELKRVIVQLELIAISQEKDLEECFATFLDNLNPINLLKSIWHSAFSRPRSGNLAAGLVELGTGFAGRRLIFGKNKSLIGKMAGKVLGEITARLFKRNKQRLDSKKPLLLSNNLP